MLRIIGGKAQSLSFNGYANSGAFSASYSFGGMSLGEVASDRLIVVCVANHSVNVPGRVTAMSVAGVSATRQGGAVQYDCVSRHNHAPNYRHRAA